MYINEVTFLWELLNEDKMQHEEKVVGRRKGLLTVPQCAHSSLCLCECEGEVTEQYVANRTERPI